MKTGVYYFKRPNEFYDDLSWINPILVAGKGHPEGIVVYHTALRLVGEAYSESRVFQVGVPKSVSRVTPPFEFQNAEYRFYRVDGSFGVQSTVVDNVKIRHFSKERIVIASLPFALYSISHRPTSKHTASLRDPAASILPDHTATWISADRSSWRTDPGHYCQAMTRELH